MYRTAPFGVAAALSLLLAGSAWADYPAPRAPSEGRPDNRTTRAAEPAEEVPWYTRYLGIGKKKAESAKPVERPVETPMRSSLTPREESELVLKTAQLDYMRRLNAATRLREIALERNDEMLMRRADDLERQAGEVYQLSIGNLPCARADQADRLLERPATGTAQAGRVRGGIQ